MKFQYRNWQKRIYIPDASYFVTFYTKNRFPYFKKSIFCDLFVENLHFCKKIKKFLLFGWVICYEHIHLLLQPEDQWNISKIIKSLKENVSCAINRIMAPESATTSSHFLGVYQDKYSILKYQHLFHEKHSDSEFFPKFQWQKSFHDHYIRNENDFDYHMEYIEYNPDKHKLPINWQYVYTNPKYEDLIDEC